MCDAAGRFADGRQAASLDQHSFQKVAIIFKKIIIKYTNCRYIPQLGDHIVGVVTSRVGELYKVDIGSADQAYVSFPSALSVIFRLPDQFPLVRRRHEAEQTESGRGRRALRADREGLEASRARAQLCRCRTQVQGNGQTRGWIRFQSIFFFLILLFYFNLTLQRFQRTTLAVCCVPPAVC